MVVTLIGRETRGAWQKTLEFISKDPNEVCTYIHSVLLQVFIAERSFGKKSMLVRHSFALVSQADQVAVTVLCTIDGSFIWYFATDWVASEYEGLQ